MWMLMEAWQMITMQFPGMLSCLTAAVSWSLKRQEIVSLSTMESEYVAITHARKEAKWLWSLISEIFRAISEPTTLFSNNQSAIALTQDHQYHAHSKHIDIQYHFIQ